MLKFRRPSGKYATLLSITALTFIIVSYSFCTREDKEQLLVQLTTKILNMNHFSPVDIDDAFSEKVFNLYLKRLDYNKRFFTKEDIKKIEPFKHEIDDEIRSRSLEFYTTTNDLFFKSIDKIQVFFNEILAKPFTFNGNESFETDPEKTDYAKDDAELKQLWEKELKYQVLVRVTELMENQENITNDTVKKKSFDEMEVEARTKVQKLYTDLLKRLKQTSEPDRIGIFLNAITSIYDPHTQYFTPDEKASFDYIISGQMEGIGAQLQEVDGYVKVVDIVVGSASWLQGELKVDDVIMKVKQENQDPVDIFDMPINEVVKLIRGKKGTKVTLFVKKVNGATKYITITRDVVINKETYAKSAIINDSIGKIGYIYLPKFYANFGQSETGHSCATDVAIEVEKLKNENVQGIILDLRNNGGGSLQDAVRMGGLFVGKGPIVQVKTKDGSPKILDNNDTSDHTGHFDGPMVVMVNSYSASASEILAAAMQDYHRAIIIGTSTFGKGTVQNQIDLDETVSSTYQNYKPLGALLITIQKFYRVNGGSTQLKGVTPDILLPDPYSELETGEREQEFCMPWNKINPAPYTSWTGLPKFSQIVNKENAQIANDPDFKVVKEQALEMKKQKNQTIEPLNLEKYKKQNEEWKEKTKSFEAIMKKSTGLKIKPPVADLAEINGDTVSLAKSNNWITELSKDIYLKQAVQTIRLSSTIK